MPQPRIALLDIETAPILAWVWESYDTNVIDYKQPSYIISFAYKWLGEHKVHVHCLADYPNYDRHREDDKALMRTMWKVLDEADVIIAHNGDRFDFRKTNGRFIKHGILPPTPYKTIDTLKVAKRHFKFDSNKLDNLGNHLRVGRKIPHTGFHLWRGCMDGDPKAWAKMKRYNAQDVSLLERVYLKLRPWISNHPNLAYYTNKKVCPACQSEKIKKHAFVYQATGKKQRYTCHDCGHRFINGPLIRHARS